MKKLTVAFIFSVFTLFAFSQDTAKISSIKTLLEVSGSGKLGEQVVQNMFASFKQSFPNVPEEFWNNVMKDVHPEVLITSMIPIYDKYYTTEEINKMIEFYQTPLGKKLIATMPQIMQASVQEGQSWGKEVGEKVYNSLKEKGYVNDKQ